MDLTAKELLREKGISFQTKDNFGDWLVDTTEVEIISIMDAYAEMKWKQACKLQTQKCSEKVYELLCEDDDAESWYKKVKTTKIIEYDNEPEFED